MFPIDPVSLCVYLAEHGVEAVYEVGVVGESARAPHRHQGDRHQLSQQPAQGVHHAWVVIIVVNMSTNLDNCDECCLR